MDCPGLPVALDHRSAFTVHPAPAGMFMWVLAVGLVQLGALVVRAVSARDHALAAMTVLCRMAQIIRRRSGLTRPLLSRAASTAGAAPACTRRPPTGPATAGRSAWYDDQGRQRKRNFALKEGRDPSPAATAEAFDNKIQRDLNTGEYADPAADVTLQAYAEDWRKTRRHDTVTAEAQERRLRLHVYEDPSAAGRTPRGGVAIGQRKLRELARRPSLVAAWLAAMPLQAPSARLVADDVSAVFHAAVDDGLGAGRDPVRAAINRTPAAQGREGAAVDAGSGGGDGGRAAAAVRVRAVAGAPGRACGEGELFGLAVDDIAFLGRNPHVTVSRQVKLVGGRR